ncbi:MAG: hypothetical protein ACI4DK_07965, partial [Lachnospiraceae bacterium]
RSQILGALLEEFDEKKYAKTLREEGWEAGRESGREEGIRIGRESGLQDGRKEMAEAIARQLNLSVEEVLKIGENSKL